MAILVFGHACLTGPAEALIVELEGEVQAVSWEPATPQSAIDAFSPGTRVSLSTEWDDAGTDTDPEPDSGAYDIIREATVRTEHGVTFEMAGGSKGSFLTVHNNDLGGLQLPLVPVDEVGWVVNELGSEDEVSSSLADFDPHAATFAFVDEVPSGEVPRMIESDAIPTSPILPDRLHVVFSEGLASAVVVNVGTLRIAGGPAVRWEFEVEVTSITDPGNTTGVLVGDVLSGGLFFDPTLTGTFSGTDTTHFQGPVLSAQVDVGGTLVAIPGLGALLNTIDVTDSEQGDAFRATVETGVASLELELLSAPFGWASQNLPATPPAGLDLGGLTLNLGGFGGLARGSQAISLGAEIVSIEVPEPKAWALLLVGSAVLSLTCPRRRHGSLRTPSTR